MCTVNRLPQRFIEIAIREHKFARFNPRWPIDRSARNLSRTSQLAYKRGPAKCLVKYHDQLDYHNLA